MSVYGYLFCRWIWLYLSQEVALVFLLQPVWQYVFLLCATSPFPKINSLFPPLPPPLPPCLSSIFLSLHFMVGSISIPPECLSLSVLCSLSCFSSTWPPWQGAGGLIELCLSVRFGTEAAHLPASTGQLSPFLLGWKGPSVTDNLPVREGETEEMREGVLSLSDPIVITCFFCYRFLMSRVLLIPLLLTFFLIFIPLHHTLSCPFPPAIQRQQWPESGPLNWDQGFFQYFYIPRES